MPSSSAAAAWIGVDWGTSNCRAFRFAADGAPVEQREAACGILQIAAEGHHATLRAMIGDWLDRAPEAPVLMSGMIGSRQGWVEAPYVETPADLDALARNLTTVAGVEERVLIVPGLAGPALGGGRDVMRGEETQVMGALAGRMDMARAALCLPGTHSKWVDARRAPDGGWRIERFATFMTGEVYAVMRRHSILGRLMTGDAADAASFADGLARSRAAGGLLHHLFLARTDGLFGRRPPERLAAFLSGVLIGHEVRAALEWARAASVLVIGAPDLGALYGAALGAEGVAVTQVEGAFAAARGLGALARAAGLAAE